MRDEYIKYIKLISIAGLIVIFDQITKYIIFIKLPIYHSIPVIPNFFNLTHIQNPGGAFGFLANQSSNLRHILFISASCAATVLIVYLYHTTPKNNSFFAFGLILIFGGAIGNLIDRIRLGKVVDFLDFFIGNLHWPAFNIADSSVTIGIAIFAFHVIFNKIPET